MRISIVIPAYNEEKYIGKTLKSVQELDKNGHEVEIIVINGGSTDKTKEISLSFGARVIDEPHRGIGFARQHGLRHAEGEIVLFTDADTIIPSHWLMDHLQVLSKEEVVCSFGTFKVVDGVFPYYQITNYLQPIRILLGSKIGLYFANGQNIGCKREVALRIGGFDEKLEMLEDADFVRRMSRAGKVVYLPKCIVTSSGRRSKEGVRFFLRSGWSEFRFFLLRQRDFAKFPDYR